ncbi:MAG: DNA-binding protein [Clostridium perfringens]|uniref:DNA-binding protein n=1 Tax=Clostridium perfringens TaxID=1502 RepID=UPI002246C735|nr:DNA-binding protein [Clostridium perfringens]MCX0401902.1 helix-turn-helix domain-containing protein [Clostridium perfringens]MDK0544265.1 DNA-binding protein [Clostridium perfringens]MDK0828622.1 DNA-binding protein [Clostridium perfringens]MDM0672630.1 DNA-binding protein [Clostridium perfringens]MDM0713587.1 DNA-binding protein [Clostridium perfringens]
MINISERMKEHNELVKKRTLSIKEWAEVEGISYNQALKFTHAKDFPIIRLGRERRVVVSRLDKWFEDHIGIEVI